MLVPVNISRSPEAGNRSVSRILQCTVIAQVPHAAVKPAPSGLPTAGGIRGCVARPLEARWKAVGRVVCRRLIGPLEDGW